MERKIGKAGIMMAMLLMMASIANLLILNANETIFIRADSSGESPIAQAEFDGNFVTQSSTDWWPMLWHDPSHNGYSTSTAPNTNNVLWHSYIGDSDSSVSSPVVVDGRVYVGQEYPKTFFCLDTLTGKPLWNYTTLEYTDLHSPAVANGKVYIAAENPFSPISYGRLYCLDALTGEYIWNYTIGDGWYPLSPAIVNDKIYVGFGLYYYGPMDGRVLCLNASTGTLIWNYTVGASPKAAAVAYDKVYVSSSSRLFCLDAFTGAQIWNYTVACSTAPTAAYDKVYVASDSRLFCLDAFTGAQIWNSTVDSHGAYPPAVAYGKVYIGGMVSTFCLDAFDGTLIWNQWRGWGPVIADGKVFGMSSDWFFCSDAFTGALLWYYYFGPAATGRGAVIADGVVYAGTGYGCVYAFGSVRDVAITNVTPSKTVVGQGYSMSINVTVANQGDYPETFNVTVYANTTEIGRQEITLASSTSTTLTFTWNTTGFAKGNYSVWAYAWPVLGEKDKTDNTYTDGWVVVTILGDINGDLKVDVKDLVLVIKYFGSYPGHPIKPWNPNADVNSDNKVDIKDLVLVIKHFGEHYP